MANTLTIVAPVQLGEQLQCHVGLTNDHPDWSGIRAEIRPNLVPTDMALPACSDHLLTLSVNPTIEAQHYSDDVRSNHMSDAGDMSLVPAGHPIRLSFEQGSLLYLFIQPAFISRVAGQAFYQGGDPVTLRHVCNFRNEPLHRISLALNDGLHTPGCGNKAYVDSLATALVVLLLRHYSSVGEPLRDGAATRSHLLTWQWSRVTEYIKTHLDGDLRLDELARITGMSVCHFARLFKDRSGVSPHQYVMYQRVERAKHLLGEKRTTILQVCLAVGFLNPAHFTTVFRKLTGITPKAYRDKQ